MKLNFLRKKKEITLDEYKNLLELHDWNYSDSSDPIRYDEGTHNHNKLLRIASINEEFRRAFFTAKEKYQPSRGK